MIEGKIHSLKFDDVLFGYEESKPVFENVSLEVPVGTNVFVTGPDGNGQSTFLKLLAVLVQPQSGRYLINGLNTTEMSFEEFLPWRMRIGYTFDYGGLFANRTLTDNLSLGLLYHKISTPEEASERIIRMAETFGFTRQLDYRPAAVSGGLRKLVCILRAFLMKPELLVMDDPSTGIGPESARKLIQLIDRSREAGWLKHIYFTSRDETWPDQLGCSRLIMNRCRFEFQDRKVA
jgi:phospholipid/cholesterol/gamma-HCH transport system ATP-binding protein